MTDAYHPIFDDFAMPPGEQAENTRYDIGSPWVAGGWRYATNGRCLVWQPTKDQDSPSRKVPNVQPVIDKFQLTGVRIVLPKTIAPPEQLYDEHGAPDGIRYNPDAYALGTDRAFHLAARYLALLIRHRIDVVRTSPETGTASFTFKTIRGIVAGCTLKAGVVVPVIADGVVQQLEAL